MGREHRRGLAVCCGPGLSCGCRVTVIPTPGWGRRRTASKHTSETADRPHAITGWSPGTSFPPCVGLKIGLHTTGQLACPRAGALWVCMEGMPKMEATLYLKSHLRSAIHSFCPTLFIGIGSLGLVQLQERRHRSVTTRRKGSLGAVLGAAYHICFYFQCPISHWFPSILPFKISSLIMPLFLFHSQYLGFCLHYHINRLLNNSLNSAWTPSDPAFISTG